jgi:hypothetical protein
MRIPVNWLKGVGVRFEPPGQVEMSPTPPLFPIFIVFIVKFKRPQVLLLIANDVLWGCMYAFISKKE